jgi:hypothetical protein
MGKAIKPATVAGAPADNSSRIVNANEMGLEKGWRAIATAGLVCGYLVLDCSVWNALHARRTERNCPREAKDRSSQLRQRTGKRKTSKRAKSDF